MTHYHTERLEELRKQHAELTKEIEELESAKLWEPEGGRFYIIGSGDVAHYESQDAYRLFGIERKTREQAEKACDKMRVFNRLHAYVDEACGGYDFIVGGAENYCIVYDHDLKQFTTDKWISVQYTGLVYMPRQTAIELCEKLNSGEVVL